MQKKIVLWGDFFMGYGLWVMGYGLPVTGRSDVQKHLILYHSAEMMMPTHSEAYALSMAAIKTLFVNFLNRQKYTLIPFYILSSVH